MNMSQFRRQRAGKIEALQNLSEGSYSTGGELLHWEYYDRYTLAHGVTTNDLFVTPNGQGGKTLADTNTTTAAQIPTGQKMVVRALALQYISAAAITAAATIELVQKYLDNTIVEVSINNKYPLLQIPASRIMGLSLSSAIGLATPALATAGSQFGMFNGVYHLKARPIVLAGLTPYKVRFTSYVANDSSIDGDQVRLSMLGSLTRAV